MKRLFLLVILSLFFVGPVFSYDQGLAKSYEQYFSSFSGKGTAKALQMIPTKAFVESLKKGDKLFIVDVRTIDEAWMYGLYLPNSLVLSMDEVFKPGSLARIPTEGKVVIVCKSGKRAMVIATGLRHIGFTNVFVLKAGLAGLVNYISPKNVY